MTDCWSPRVSSPVRILVADAFADRQLKKLEQRGYEVSYRPQLDAQTITTAVADAEVLVVRSTPVSAETIQTGKELGLIIRAGAGTDTIDVDFASSKGVYVSSVPGRNAVAVAELTMGLILSLDRRIPDNVADMREGKWRKSAYSKTRGLKGRVLGIVGLGAIGLKVATRAHSFGMKLAGLDQPGRTEEQSARISDLGFKLYPSLETLLPECDIVSLHVPATSDTVGMVDADFLSHMRHEAVLINTSRGELVVADDLLDALDTKDMWAGLDVFPDEPKVGETEFDSGLGVHPRVYGTHHIGASTQQAQEAIAKQVVKIVDGYSDGSLVNVVNLAPPMPTTTVISVRHIDQVGVLSRVFAVLRSANLNVEHVENHVFAGARAANAVIHLHGDFTEAVLGKLAEQEAVLHVAVLRETP